MSDLTNFQRCGVRTASATAKLLVLCGESQGHGQKKIYIA